MTKDYKNFSEVANLAVERVKLKNVERSKFCETDIAKRRWLIHISRRVLRTVFERRRRSTSGRTMLVDEIKRKKCKNEKKCRNDVIRNLCLECLLDYL